MYKEIKKIFLLSFLFLLVTAGCDKKINPSYSTPLLVGQKQIFVEVVNTPEKMAQGLSGRKKLTDDEGMLFDFSNVRSKTKSGPSTSSGQNAGKPAFWMKGMKFDLDLIWIKDKKIVGITPNVPAPRTSSTSPASQPSPSSFGGQVGTLPRLDSESKRASQGEGTLEVYSPPTEVDMVLEVNAGWAEKNKIKVGDEINLK